MAQSAPADLIVAGRAPGPTGSLRPPSDKSISLRALLLSAMAPEATRIECVLESADTRAMRGALVALGARIEEDPTEPGALVVCGDVRRSDDFVTVDARESGTTARLLFGALATSERRVVLEGRDSLLSRPMARVVAPLSRMGVSFEDPARDRLPIAFRGARELLALRHDLPIASAQVKSAILLAALGGKGVTQIREPLRSRDHTERMLGAFGVQVEVDGTTLRIAGPQRLGSPRTPLRVPADLSSALYLGVAALVLDSAQVLLREVGINDTRAGALAVLARMGARVRVSDRIEHGFEPIGDLSFRSSELVGVEVRAEEFPALLDDVPILAVAAACARQGATVFRGASELRVKESDRIASIAAMLRAFGATVTTDAESLRIEGGAVLRPARVDSHGDHRIALAATVLALAMPGESRIDGFSCVAKSYPGILDDLRALGLAPDRLRDAKV